MPCVESMGRPRCRASTTSASVTFSHLHTTFCFGSVTLPTAPARIPFHPSLGVIIGARMGLKLTSLVKVRPASCSRRTTSRAMAGLPARPGESIPAALMNCLEVAHCPMTQSPVLFLARAPAKVWITSDTSKAGTSSRHLPKIKVRISSVVSAATSGRCMSRAVGPRMRLPHSVVCTSTPLPSTGWGQGNSVWLARCPWFLFSNT
mmetsp:Transcript_19638/g.43809  ORF Transcript_19638/g.43809 Transcript_19638/m.43809 type:complete len:205 (+) Transcript_19638:527-1141(+)